MIDSHIAIDFTLLKVVCLIYYLLSSLNCEQFLWQVCCYIRSEPGVLSLGTLENVGVP